MISIRRLGFWLFVSMLMFIQGCTGLYFRDAGQLPSRPPKHDLRSWPYHEYWTGVIFNGKKIGFTHLSLIGAADAPNLYDISSEAVLRFRFLMFDKGFNLKSFDRVAEDLALRRFEYDYNMDGNTMKLSGTVRGGSLEVETAMRGQVTTKSIPLKTNLYPTSAIGLYPVLHGLLPGRCYRYQVYDGQTGTVSKVTQEILAYEKSDLFSGKAFKIRTTFQGEEVTTWIDARGKPLLEMSWGGVLISGLEEEAAAKEYLIQAAISKDDVLLEVSLIRSEILIEEPRDVKSLDVTLVGIQESLSIPSDANQRCRRDGKNVRCQINAQEPEGGREVLTREHGNIKRYLRPSFAVQSGNRLIEKTARDMTVNEKTTSDQLRKLILWIQKNVRKEPVDVFTALDVFLGGKADCQGHAYLYAAFARALGIPTRVVNGIVYMTDYQGFLYHTWVESFVTDRWVSIDPTLGQLPADATHIKLVEGESTADLGPLINLIGRLQVRINAVGEL